MAIYLGSNKVDGATANTTVVDLTQAEYDALTTEEKNNGNVYCVTDASGTYLTASEVSYGSSSVQSALDDLGSTVSSISSWERLYYNSTAYQNDIGTTLPLSDSISKYHAVHIQAYEQYYNSSSRRYIDIPYLTTLAGFYSFGTDTGVGSVRLEFNSNGLYIISSTASSLFIQGVWGKA